MTNISLIQLRLCAFITVYIKTQFIRTFDFIMDFKFYNNNNHNRIYIFYNYIAYQTRILLSRSPAPFFWQKSALLVRNILFLFGLILSIPSSPYCYFFLIFIRVINNKTYCLYARVLTL